MANCCSKKMTETITREFISYRKDCEVCNGTGRAYASDGVYLDCSCEYGSGRHVVYFECEECFNNKMDPIAKTTK